METNKIQNDVLRTNSVTSERAEFVKKTYMHLAGAMAAFALLVTAFIKLGYGEIAIKLLGKSQYSWLIVLAVFMAVSYFANKMAHSRTSKNMQYMGLSVYVFVEAAIFIPLIYVIMSFDSSGELLQNAALVTGALVTGLTAVVFLTGKNFSFLGRFLMIGGFIAIGVIIASIVFGFSLGLLFSGIMIVFAAGSILYNTSNIVHEYNEEQYVAAALGLFASIALMLWYVIQFMMSFFGNND